MVKCEQPITMAYLIEVYVLPDCSINGTMIVKHFLAESMLPHSEFGILSVNIGHASLPFSKKNMFYATVWFTMF